MRYSQETMSQAQEIYDKHKDTIQALSHLGVRRDLFWQGVGQALHYLAVLKQDDLGINDFLGHFVEGTKPTIPPFVVAWDDYYGPPMLELFSSKNDFVQSTRDHIKRNDPETATWRDIGEDKHYTLTTDNVEALLNDLEKLHALAQQDRKTRGIGDIRSMSRGLGASEVSKSRIGGKVTLDFESGVPEGTRKAIEALQHLGLDRRDKQEFGINETADATNGSVRLVLNKSTLEILTQVDSALKSGETNLEYILQERQPQTHR
jgi:hypothetical protein